jgi:hypothetical protein
MVKLGCIYSQMEGEGWCGQNSKTLVDPCQLPIWLIETRMENERFVGYVSKWHTFLSLMRTQLQSGIHHLEALSLK